MGGGVGGAEDVDRVAGQIGGALLGGDDARPSAVGDDAAVELVQRVGHQPRRDDVLDGDRLALLGLGIGGGVVPHGHRHRGQLLGGGAELVHVPPGRHGVVAHQGVAPQGVVDGGPRGEATSAPAAGAQSPPHLRELDAAVGDEHHVDGPGLHRVGGVLHEHLERRPARVGLVEVDRVQAQVLGHPGGVHGEEAGGGEAVDIGEGQARRRPGPDRRPGRARRARTGWGDGGSPTWPPRRSRPVGRAAASRRAPRTGAGRGRVAAARKRGTASSGPMSSHATSTGMPTATSSGSTSTRFDTMRAPPVPSSSTAITT